MHMKKQLYLLAIAAFLQLVLLVSCSDDGCGGPFPNRFRTVDLEPRNLKLMDFNSSTDEYSFQPLPAQEVVSEKDYFIELTPVKESYTAFRQSTRFSFIEKAYAYSPIPPHSDEVITSIIITADKDFNPEFTKSEKLAALFDVIVVDHTDGVNNQRMSLPGYLALSPNIKDKLYLVLNAPPQKADIYNFEIQFSKSLAGEKKLFRKQTQEVKLDPGA